MNITNITRGYAARGAFLVLIATLITACGGGSDGQVSVPNVVGDTQSAATTAITGAGLTVGTVTQAPSSTVASGSVVIQSPVAGTTVSGGQSVSLIVSSGPAPATVPNVVGDTQAAATTAITGAGLKVGTLTQAASSTIAKGDVISENPAANTSVATGSAVALVVSTGPTAFTVGGKLIGLAPSATVHVVNGADSLPVSANGSFTLPTAVIGGGTYSVTVGTPTSTQTCGVQNGSGSIASANVTDVVVYCTYNVSAATLHSTYTTVGADFGASNAGTATPFDVLDAQTYDGVSAISGTATVNINGTIVPNQSLPGTYTVTTTNAIPSLDGSGGIEGVNGGALAGLTTTSGTPPTVAFGVLPDASATTNSINGNYTAVFVSVSLSTGQIQASEGPLTLTNGAFTGTLTSNTAGTITTGNPNQGQLTVANGILTQTGTGAGAVSTDGNLIVKADTNSGDDPAIYVWVRQGSGVTLATFEGVYSVGEYGGFSKSTTFGQAITVFAYGDGTFSLIATKNAQGVITTNNMDTGTYTVTSDGTLILTTDGTVYHGAISADGNALAIANVGSAATPSISVGVRQ